MKSWIEAELQKFNIIIENNKVPHALIIYGDKKIGKLELAQKIVEKLTGENVENDNLAIDLTNDKILLRNSNYQGLVYCQKEIKEKAKKVSQIISINQVREFCDFLEKTNNKIQIGIINYADELNNNASNALLKTLEEPRKNTLIILLAHNIKNIPITILSRCQKIHLSANENSITWIKQNITTQIDDIKLSRLLKHNFNNPVIVAEKINNNEIEIENKWENELLTIALNPNNISNISNIKTNEIKILTCLQNLVLEFIEFKTLQKTSENKIFNHLLEKTEIKMLFNFLTDINKAKNLISTNANFGLLLDNLLIVWSHITHLEVYPHIFMESK